MKNIYIGIFETPTKTYIKVEDDKERILGKETIGPINLYLSAGRAWEMIVKGIEQALQSSSVTLNKKDCAFHVGLGLRYTQMDNAVRELIQKNKECGLFKSFVIRSDCYVLAVSQKPNHAVIIVDEGIVGNAITKTDEFKVGGWGFPLMDKGSILWLGAEAYRYTLQWIEGSIDKPTLLLKAIYKHFNNDTATMVAWAMNDFLNQTYQYRLLSDMVLNFYNLRDEIAIDLVTKSAHEVEKIYETIKKLTNTSNIPLSLYGELVKYVTPLLSQSISKNMHIIYDGTIGAIKLIHLAKH